MSEEKPGGGSNADLRSAIAELAIANMKTLLVFRKLLINIDIKYDPDPGYSREEILNEIQEAFSDNKDIIKKVIGIGD